MREGIALNYVKTYLEGLLQLSGKTSSPGNLFIFSSGAKQ